MAAPRSDSAVRTAFHQVDWGEDASVVAFVERVWTERSRAQVRAEQLGELTAAWYNGDQYLYVTSAGRGFKIEPLPNPYGRLRLTFNLFGPHLDQWIARTAMDVLEPECRPTGGSQVDLDAARLQTAVCRYYTDLLDLQGLKDTFVRQVAFEGMGFSEVTWDPAAGSEFELTREETQRYRLDGDVLEMAGFDGPEVRQARLATGEVRVEAVSLRNLTWGPVGVAFRDAEYVVKVRERSVAYVMGRWGLREEEVQTAYDTAARRWYRGTFAAGGTLVYEDHPDLVLVYELWAPRSPAHPRGLHAVVVGNKVANRKRNRGLANPYAHGKVPFVACKALDMPDQPLGKTPAWDMLQPQAMINKLAGQIQENIELFANPRLWVPENEPIDEFALNSKPGGLHKFRNRKPEIMEGVELPSSLYAVFDRWIRILQETIGVHDVSMGKAPAQGRSGRYVLALQDSDNTRLSPTLKGLARWAADTFRLLLCVVRQFVTEERLIAIRGENAAWERRAFRGDQLAPGAERSGPEVFNVLIKTNGQARSPAAQADLVTLMMQFGFLKPERAEDRQLVMRVLQLGESVEQADPAEIHRSLQRLVHEQLYRGQYVKPEYFQNHDVRLAELRREMNTTAYQQASPEIRALFVRYEKETIEIQATWPLVVQATTQQAVQRFQQAQQVLAQQSQAVMGGLQNQMAMGELNRRLAAARMVRGPQAPAPRMAAGPMPAAAA